jgi:hypothetical protein
MFAPVFNSVFMLNGLTWPSTSEWLFTFTLKCFPSEVAYAFAGCYAIISCIIMQHHHPPPADIAQPAFKEKDLGLFYSMAHIGLLLFYE